MTKKTQKKKKNIIKKEYKPVSVHSSQVGGGWGKSDVVKFKQWAVKKRLMKVSGSGFTEKGVQKKKTRVEGSTNTRSQRPRYRPTEKKSSEYRYLTRKKQKVPTPHLQICLKEKG